MKEKLFILFTSCGVICSINLSQHILKLRYYWRKIHLIFYFFLTLVMQQHADLGMILKHVPSTMESS